jgi:hypothetical protein
MTVNEAIRLSRKRVSICSFGRGQHVVHCWSPQHNATWVSQPMDWHRASATAREDRIRVALSLLGVEDSNGEANFLAYEPGSWDVLVKDYAGRN